MLINYSINQYILTVIYCEENNFVPTYPLAEWTHESWNVWLDIDDDYDNECFLFVGSVTGNWNSYAL